MSVRKSVISGTWYPAKKEILEAEIQKYLQHVDQISIDSPVLGLIAPHAGYIYSGSTAAYSYKQIENHNYEVIVVLSPIHQYPTGKYLITDHEFYGTPLGNIKVYHELVNELENNVDITKTKLEAEHSLEIQLPFLQIVQKDFKLLPIMIGHGDVSLCEELANALYHVLNGKNYLIIASSDMYHTNDYQLTKEKDEIAIDILTSINFNRIKNLFESHDCSICGKIPILTMLHTLNLFKNNIELKAIHHTTSGDVTGETTSGNYTVGYLSAVVY